MSISYIEKGIGLHDAIRAAGHVLWCENGVWRSSDDTIVQALIDAYDGVAGAKTEKLAALRHFRWQREEAGVEVGGVAMDTARDARPNLTGAVIGAMIAAQFSQPFSATWKTATGDVVEVDGSTMIQLGVGVTAYVGACFAREAELAAEIAALTDRQAVLDFDFTTGWP